MSLNPKLLEMMLNLHRSGESGLLRARKESAKKQLVVRKGLLAFAESNQPEEHLARIMVSMGLLPRAKLREIAALMKTGKTSEESVLAVVDFDKRILEKARFEQSTVVMASLLGWRDFDLRFYPGDDRIRYQANLGLSLPEFLVVSARRAVSKRLVRIPAGFLQRTISQAEASDGNWVNFPLNSAESYAYSLLREPMNVADLLSLTPASEAPPEELILRLYVLGLVRLEAPAASQSGDKPAANASGSPASILEDMVARFETASLYEILSIPADATPEVIQAAYHSLAKQFHPDRFQSEDCPDGIRKTAERVFTFINAAYTTLRDPVARANYDETRLAKESQVEAAIKARAAADAEEEKMIDALFREGKAALARGDFEKAVEHLKNCVWKHPEKAIFHCCLGMAESEIPRLRKSAEQHLLKAIELESISAEAHLALAKLYMKVMLPRKAEAQLQDVLRLDPENKEAHRLRAELEKTGSSQAGIYRRIKFPFSR